MKKTFLSQALSRGFFAAALASLLAFAPGMAPQASAQDHVVAPQVLQQQVQKSTASREADIANVTNFLSTPEAQHAMKSARIDPSQVQNAVPTLSNTELASLSQRATDAQQDFAAGRIGTGMLLVIVVAIAVVIILIAVH